MCTGQQTGALGHLCAFREGPASFVCRGSSLTLREGVVAGETDGPQGHPHHMAEAPESGLLLPSSVPTRTRGR